MKNLIIFVLALIALSSVCSVKLNKVLKEEKILSVSIPNEKVELNSETLTDDTKRTGGNGKSESLETNTNNENQKRRNKVEESILNKAEKIENVDKLEKVEKSNKSFSKQSCEELTDVLKALEGNVGYEAVKELISKNNC